MTSADVLAALRTRYLPPQWYLLTEVANGTGYKGKTRETYADAVAINAYQSGKYGAEIHGFEIKVTRADWLNELKDPGKSAEVRKFCDRWYVVAPPGVVQATDELSGAGYLCVADGTITTEWEAALVGDAPLTRAFVAALVRRASEERADKEALRGSLLKAPLRQVAKSPHRGLHVLVCGHLMPQHGVVRRLPKAMRCLACLDGLPPTSEIVLEGFKAMSPEDAEQVLAKLNHK